jgi:hypothetical protein
VAKQTFQLARCGCILRVTSQTSYSPEYITPTHTRKCMTRYTNILLITRYFLSTNLDFANITLWYVNMDRKMLNSVVLLILRRHLIQLIIVFC